MPDSARMIATAKTLFRQRPYLLTRLSNDWVDNFFILLDAVKNICNLENLQ